MSTKSKVFAYLTEKRGYDVANYIRCRQCSYLVSRDAKGHKDMLRHIKSEHKPEWPWRTAAKEQK